MGHSTIEANTCDKGTPEMLMQSKKEPAESENHFGVVEVVVFLCTPFLFFIYLSRDGVRRVENIFAIFVWKPPNIT